MITCALYLGWAQVLAFSMLGLGGPEIAVIVLVLIFFFGAKRIPGIARGLGRSISEFKKGKDEDLPKDDTKA